MPGRGRDSDGVEAGIAIFGRFENEAAHRAAMVRDIGESAMYAEKGIYTFYTQRIAAVLLLPDQ